MQSERELTADWTSEQRRAYSALKRSRAYDAVEPAIWEHELTGKLTFEDVWYAVAYETDYVEDDFDHYIDLPADERWDMRAYRYAVKWRDKNECLLP